MSRHQIVNDYRPDDPWVRCQRSGFKVRASETVVDHRAGGRVRRDLADRPDPALYMPPPRGEEIIDYPTGEGGEHYVTDDEIAPVYPKGF